MVEKRRPTEEPVKLESPSARDEIQTCNPKRFVDYDYGTVVVSVSRIQT